jgi:excisionase family DNA binding protein
MSKPEDDRLLTINEVSKLTQLTVGSLYHLVSQKRIPVVRLSKRCIRFRLSALTEWFDSLSQQPTEPGCRAGRTR